MRRGSYILIVELKEDEEISVGKLGILRFGRGYYAYAGSAMGGLDARIGRHMRQDKKKHWHIDYLLEKGMVRQVWYLEDEKIECEIARAMESEFGGIAGFGSSDCRCRSHLFHSESMDGLEKVARNMGMKKYGVRAATKYRNIYSKV